MGRKSRFSCLLLALAGPAVLALAGCGGASPARAGAITVTSANGSGTAQLTSVGVGQTARLTMAPSGDVTGAGVDWAVTCGGSPVNGSITGGACGTLNPVHTSDGGATIYTAPSLVPYLTDVTITATVTSDPAAKSAVTLPIVALPIAVVLGAPVPTTLGAGQTVLFMAGVLNDPANGGVIWSVTCGSASCGSFDKKTAASPNYTAPAAVPAGGTVTVTATSVSDSTKSASATVTIVASTALAVAITTALPATLAENATASLRAAVSNDPANLGVDWKATCGSAGACGTFNLSPAHTASGAAIVYTAPAAIPTGSNVTITATATAASATNPSSPATESTTIVQGAAAIALTEAPPATVTATTRVPVSATVTNDAVPGGVTWSVQCAATGDGACGYVTPAQTADGASASYVAPPVAPTGAVTITATSTAFPSLTASSAVTIAADTTVSIGFVPFAPAQVTTGTTINLTAAVANDATNAGVDWQVCASGCGFFTTQAAIPEVPATPTTPLIPAVPAVTATSVQGWPNGLPIPYTAPDAVPQSGDVAIAATAHANSGVAVAQNVAVTTAVTGPALNGVVQAGTLPVAGAQVSLYAAGTSGYGSAATALVPPGGASSATTKSDGSFTFAGGYTCPAGGQVYLVATGGKAGSFAANPNLAMMTALGPCSNLSATPVVINEVTTVASVWPLAPFSTNEPLTGVSGYLNVGTSSTNTTGLARAFATVNNLVDVTTGQPRYNVPTGNAAVPYVEINTIADALNACTASGGGQYGDGSACGALFSATSYLYGLGTYHSIATADTLQAAFNAAQHPSSVDMAYFVNVSIIYGLVSNASPFQPSLTTAPRDLGISLHYVSGGGLSGSSGASSIAIDAADNVWISATAANELIELNSNGAAISPAGGYPAGGIKGPGPIAIDTSGNVWVANFDSATNSGSLTELNSNGSAAQGSPFYGVGKGLNLAIDGLNDIWITTPGGVTEYNNLGAELSPVGGYVNSGIAGISQLTIDPSNNIWVGYVGPTNLYMLAELANNNGELIVDASTTAAPPPTPMVSDASGNIFFTPAMTDFYKLPAYVGQLAANYVPSMYMGGPSGDFQSIYNPNGIALDGGNDLWIANSGGDGNAANLTGVPLSVLSGKIYSELDSSSLGAGTVQVAVDGAGNAWVLLADSSVTEFVGVAVPAATPLAAAIANKKVGKTP